MHCSSPLLALPHTAPDVDSKADAFGALSTVGAMLRRSLIAALSLAAIVLTGCTDTTRIPPADPTPTDAPLFSSDEEALAAATEVYEEYWNISSEILQVGGEEPERLQPLVSDSLFERELQGFRDFESQQWRLVGQPVVQSTKLQQLLVVNAESAEVYFYACVSSQGTDVVDTEGESVIQDGREQLSTFEAATLFQDGAWTVTASDLWQGESVCD